MLVLFEEQWRRNDVQVYATSSFKIYGAFADYPTLGVTRNHLMPKRSGYNTNLAAEFYVLSMLHRLGFSASLTLGNRKAIDLIVETEDRTITIDVKGMASRTNWPLDNFTSKDRKNHYIVLVSFNNKIHDPSVPPTVYVVPAAHIPNFFYSNPKGTRQTIPYSTMKEKGQQYLNAWDSFDNAEVKPRIRRKLKVQPA